MEDLLVIADVAGQFDALMRLIARVPKTTKILAVGDLVDRGPNSRECVEWFMWNQDRADTLLANHEHMMIDYCRDYGIYYQGVWFSNGGTQTMWSYEHKIPEWHIEFLASRLMFKMIKGDSVTPDMLVSHAALNAELTIEQASSIESTMDMCHDHFDYNFLWNRTEPIPRPYFQVMGHNSHWGLRSFAGKDGKAWALCIDQSKDKILTGLHWPSMEILEEPYVVEKKREPEVLPG